MSVNVLQQRTATEGYDVMGGGTKQPDDITVDTTPTADSANPISSGGVYSALETKQDVLTFDDVPTNGSDNPVKSDGIFDALSEKTGLKTLNVLINPTGSYFTMNAVNYLKSSYILTQCANANIDATKPIFVSIIPAVAPVAYTYLIMNLKDASTSDPNIDAKTGGIIYGKDSSTTFNGTDTGFEGGTATSGSGTGAPYRLYIAGFTK